MSKTYEQVSTRATPQREPILGESQVKNNAGGFVYDSGPWAALQRFLVLGTEGGTYYVNERALTRESAQNVLTCLAQDARRVIDLTVAISDSGRAPKNDPAIFVLALAASSASAEIRAYALAQLRKVCRIPTHLFHFLAYVQKHRGWGRALRRAVQEWYASQDVDRLAHQMVKYQARDGWSHRDALRLAHVQLPKEYQPLLRWALGLKATKRTVTRANAPDRSSTYARVGRVPAIVEAFEAAKTASVPELVTLIREHKLTREMLPTEGLNNVRVWEALLDGMPMTAMLRNLGKMTSVGLVMPMSQASKTIVSALRNTEALRRSRVHPMAVLNALRVYEQGHGDRGKLTWKPVSRIVGALNDAFYASFGNVEPTNKRLMLALDVSGSMDCRIAGTGLTCRDACAAIALVTMHVEPQAEIFGFTTTLSPLSISPDQRLDDVVRHMRALTFGGTDCSMPMMYATSHRLECDAFAIYTDSETWAGRMHPSQALRKYRARFVQDARLVVNGMTSTRFTIADPKDPLQLDVVGFDTATPQAISEFVR